MREYSVTRDDTTLYARLDGIDDPTAPTIVFSNALGTGLDLWDGVFAHLADGLRLIRYDMRGHGRSDTPAGRYSMGQLVSDAAAVCDAMEVRDAIFVGISVGGMVAQGLAVKRPDLIRALVLSNTAAKIGNPDIWQTRIDTVRASGVPALVDDVMGRWFGRDFHRTGGIETWRKAVSGCDPAGYAGVCAAISGTDFYTPTSGIRIPTLGIAGSEDGSTPADLVRETVDLIPGSQFKVMRRCGHLPCVEAPQAYAEVLNNFIIDTGHLKS